MFKRYHLLVALLAALGLLAAACGGDDAETTAAEDTAETEETSEADDEPAEETVEETEEPEEAEPEVSETLLVWADERKIDPLNAIAPAFEEATGVSLQVELVPFGEIRDQVTQAGPAGEGPDVFTGAHDWTGELAANGVIDAVDLSAAASSIVPVALNGFNFEGQTYALPYVTEAIAMYRNTDLVADAPATWEDAVAACEAAAVDNCFVVPGGGAATDAYHQYPFVTGQGGYLFNFDPATGFDASDIGLDSAEGVKGFNFLADQVAAGNVSSTDYDTAKNLFLEGQAAYWITGPWELGGLRDQDAINWGVSLIPQMGTEPTEAFVGAQGFFVSSFSENKLLASSFLLDFLATDDVMQALYDADPRGTAWVPVQDGLTSDPEVAVFAEAAANGTPMPNIPEMAAVWGPLGDNLLLVRNGEATGDDAAATAAQAIRDAVGG